MEKIIKNSFIYGLFLRIANWIKVIFSNSFLVGLFVKETNREQLENDTIFARVINSIIEFLRKIAFKLKLDKLFDNSIFTKPIIWLTLLVACTPFLPTMIDLAILFVGLVSLFLKLITHKEFNLKYFRTNIWVIVFMGIVLLAGFTSVSLEESKRIALLVFAFISAYFLVINTIESKKQLHFLLYVFIVAGTITAIYGIYQYFTGDLYSQAWIDKETFEDIKMRAYSTFENPNVYGEYLILVIPCMLALLVKEHGWFKKLIILGMLGITLFASLLTFSRGCWLGIMLEVAILLLMIDKRFIFLGILGIAIMPFVLPETIINRFLSIGNMGDSSTSYRVYIWLGTIAMLKDYWFPGIGLGKTSFNAVYPIYSYNTVTTPHSHNLFLQCMTEYGLIGLIVFLGIIYFFYKETIISYLKKKNILLSAFIAGMTGFLLESLFDYTWYNYRVVLIFWMYIAMGHALTNVLRKEEENGESSKCN